VNWRTRKGGAGGAPHSVESAEESLEELRELATGAGAEVVDSILQQREAPDAATFVGSGKLDELKALTEGLAVDLVVFDSDLSPTQLRNLEAALECRIIDRTQLILDIFARHARTREGQLQVELAQLNYMLPRLSGQGKDLSGQGGGIGTRGPGEQKLELDRRRIRRRIATLEDALEHVRQTRTLQRAKRSGVPLPTVALVGYTNAGKSTLFNRLTQAQVLTSSRMFATLDPTLRALRLPSRRGALLSDTVGFIRGLPTALVKAFRATLEEVQEAALILHVTDASAPSREEQDRHVRLVLEELGAADKPCVLVLNKTDKLTEDELAELHRVNATATAGVRTAAVSALSGEGIEELLALLDACLPGDPVQTVRFRFPYSEGAALSLLYEHARILSRDDSGVMVEVEAEAPQSLVMRLDRFVAA
jgi:GTP-binding protein HflX